MPGAFRWPLNKRCHSLWSSSIRTPMARLHLRTHWHGTSFARNKYFHYFPYCPTGSEKNKVLTSPRTIMSKMLWGWVCKIWGPWSWISCEEFTENYQWVSASIDSSSDAFGIPVWQKLRSRWTPKKRLLMLSMQGEVHESGDRRWLFWADDAKCLAHRWGFRP